MWNMKLLIAGVMGVLIFAAGSALYAYNRGRQSGMSQVQTLWDAERAIQLAALAEAQMKARQVEQSLQHLVQRIKAENKREATRLANDYAAVIDSLHDRPEGRAGDGGLPETPGAGVGCTGAGLARGDAEFLAGVARDAARLQLAFNACKAAYDALSGVP